MKKKRRRLKKNVKRILMIIPALIAAGIIIFALVRNSMQEPPDNTAEEAGDIMKRCGYTKRTVTTYSPADRSVYASEGFVTEDELIEASVERKTVDEYDADGNLIRQTYYQDNAFVKTETTEYQDGKPVRREIRDEKDRLIRYSVVQEDEVNHEMVWYLYTPEDELIGISEVYDEKGNLAESFAFDSDDVKLYETLYQYSEKNELTGMTTWIGGKLVGTQTFLYNKGRQTESIYTGEDGTYYRHVFEYKSGHLNYSRQYDRNGREITNDRYTYDKNGLLLKDAVFKSNKYIQLVLYSYE